MDYCHPCRRHLNGALACAGCGTPAEALGPYAVPAPAGPAPGVRDAPDGTAAPSGAGDARRGTRRDARLDARRDARRGAGGRSDARPGSRRRARGGHQPARPDRPARSPRAAPRGGCAEPGGAGHGARAGRHRRRLRTRVAVPAVRGPVGGGVRRRAPRSRPGRLPDRGDRGLRHRRLTGRHARGESLRCAEPRSLRPGRAHRLPGPGPRRHSPVRRHRQPAGRSAGAGRPREPTTAPAPPPPPAEPTPTPTPSPTCTRFLWWCT